jgi:hypothetical protein
MDAATMFGLGLPSPRPVTAPSARALLPRLWAAARRPDLTRLVIAQMQVVLGTNRTAGDQQCRLLDDDRIGVDYAEVNPCHSIGVKVMLLNVDGGGNRQPQLTSLGE